MRNHVRTLRWQLRIRQDRFAKRVGLSPGALSLIERGLRSPSPEVAARIAQVLKLPVPIVFPHRARQATKGGDGHAAPTGHA